MSFTVCLRWLLFQLWVFGVNFTPGWMWKQVEWISIVIIMSTEAINVLTVISFVWIKSFLQNLHIALICEMCFHCKRFFMIILFSPCSPKSLELDSLEITCYMWYLCCCSYTEHECFRRQQQYRWKFVYRSGHLLLGIFNWTLFPPIVP